MVHRGRGHWHGAESGRPRGRARSGTRCRWRDDTDAWAVAARIERFVEPALLLVLRDTQTHGYDLAHALEELNPEERVDLGNLYRLLRSLEEEGLVESEWRDDLPGRSKRTYRLTDDGAAALAAWADALTRARTTIDEFLTRHDAGGAP
ncbi:MAG TPA: PadR family transcriptional regulator [Acidimicrobiia bacterium]|nr:PadR family transcriptional regulator [Acidimicrobiia bacterium]